MSNTDTVATLAMLGDRTTDILDLVAHNRPVRLVWRDTPVVLAYAADDAEGAHTAAEQYHSQKICRLINAPDLVVSEEQFSESPLGYIDRLIGTGNFLLVVARDADGLSPYVVFHAMRPKG